MGTYEILSLLFLGGSFLIALPVSYTHLDVYKRQIYYSTITAGANAKVEGFVMDPIGYHKLDHVKVAK